MSNFAVSLKPISIRVGKLNLTFEQSLKRHLLDIIDISFLGLVAFISIKNTQYNQRFGDIWAHTIIVNTTDNKQGVFYE